LGRRSRACAYLADDDHGPLALQEILLAGSPTVGVRTDAAFVRHDVTGCFVERLPPGPKCVASDSDEAALAAYLEAILQAQELDRPLVCAAVAEKLNDRTILDQIVSALEAERR
jgi:hypothetical protein